MINFEPATDNNIHDINHNIEKTVINGQYISLNATIRLSGRLNKAALLADCSHKTPDHTNHDDITALQIGIDEAGRGPLLGSVTVAAAILPRTWSGLIEQQPLQETPLASLTDSKQLSEKKRDILYPLVQQYALGYVVADIPAAVIDQINILQATMLGMRLCAETLLAALAHLPKSAQIQVLFDGNRCPKLDYAQLATLGMTDAMIDCQAWIKGDARHTNIAAASVLAKVSRDQTMYKMHAQHPEYGIAKHKGYPTRAHIQAIETYGVLAEHRRSFAPIKRALESAGQDK